MSPHAIHHPHDKFFKIAMSRPWVAADFLIRYGPPWLREALQPNSLVLQPSCLIGPQYQAWETDVLYRVNYQRPSQSVVHPAYVLLEHQSTIDPDLPMRMGLYSYAILAEHRKAHPQDLFPLVIRMVFYNGQARYTGPWDMRPLMSDPEQWAATMGEKPFFGISTQALGDSELVSESPCGLMVYGMKHIHDPDPADWGCFKGFFQHIIHAWKDIGYAFAALYYIFDKVSEPVKEMVAMTILQEERMDPILGRLIDHWIADRKERLLAEWIPDAQKQWEERGREQGVQQGVQQGMQQGIQRGIEKADKATLLRILHKKFHTVPPDYVDQIQKASHADIIHWTDNVLDCATIDAVFARETS